MLAYMKRAMVGSAQFSDDALPEQVLYSHHQWSYGTLTLSPVLAGTAHFVAARDIAAGEQLCISYIDASMNVNARQQQLDWGYGFRCTCVNCTEDATQQS